MSVCLYVCFGNLAFLTCGTMQSIAALGSDYTAGCDAATSAYRNDARLTNDVFTSCIAYVCTAPT